MKRSSFWIKTGVTSLLLFLFFIVNSSVYTQERDKKILPPKNGCYIGFFPGWGELEDEVNVEEFKVFEELSGKPVAISPFSNFWGEKYVSINQLNTMSKAGAIPILRLMPWGEPYWEPYAFQPDFALQKIIDGEFDEFLTKWADTVIAFGKPVMVNFGVEMNGNWFAWSGIFQGGKKKGDFGDPNLADGPERYAAAYRHIIDLFRKKGVRNATYLFHPNFESYPDEQWNDLSAYYPGDDYIDWVGVSLYGESSTDYEWYTFKEAIDPVYNRLVRLFPTKPLMLPEWGVREWKDPSYKAKFYVDALELLQTRYNRIKIAIIYHESWREERRDGLMDLRINSSTEALEAYRDGIDSKYFIDAINQ